MHNSFTALFREYLCLGGFQEAVCNYIETNNIYSTLQITRRITRDLQDDFGRRRGKVCLAEGFVLPPPPSQWGLSNAELIPPASNYGQNPVWSTYFLLRVCYVVCTRTMIKIGAVNCPFGIHVTGLSHCRAGCCKCPALSLSF